MRKLVGSDYKGYVRRMRHHVRRFGMQDILTGGKRNLEIAIDIGLKLDDLLLTIRGQNRERGLISLIGAWVVDLHHGTGRPNCDPPSNAAIGWDGCNQRRAGSQDKKGEKEERFETHF
jgi:hypothetical protein